MIFNPFTHDVRNWSGRLEDLLDCDLMYEGKEKFLFYYRKGNFRSLLLLRKSINDLSVRFFGENEKFHPIPGCIDEEIFYAVIVEDEHLILDKGFKRRDIIRDASDSFAFQKFDEKGYGYKIVLIEYHGYKIAIPFTSKDPSLSDWYTNPLIFVENDGIHKALLDFSRNYYSDCMYPGLDKNIFVEHIWFWALQEVKNDPGDTMILASGEVSKDQIPVKWEWFWSNDCIIADIDPIKASSSGSLLYE